MRLDEIAKRRARIRLSKKELAARAQLDQMTVIRSLRAGANPLNETLRKMESAVEAEETELLHHLLDLKGLVAGKRAAA